MVMTKWRHCFLSLWVRVGYGKKGACLREDGLLDVSLMGKGTAGEWEEQYFFLFGFLQRDTGQGLECG